MNQQSTSNESTPRLTRRDALARALQGTIAAAVAAPLIAPAEPPASLPQPEPEFVPENDYPFFGYEPEQAARLSES